MARRRTRYLVRQAFLVAALIEIAVGAARADERWSSLADTVFQHYTTDNGLPHALVTALEQDATGFLWVGTQGGLARWDGYRFQVYRPNRNDPAALPATMVSALYTDPRGQLWVGTSSGLARYDPERDGFVPCASEPGVANHPGVWAITDDGSGGVWAGTDSGLIRLNPKTGAAKFLHHDAQNPDSLPNDDILALARDRQGNLWLGTKIGLARYDPRADRFAAIALPLPPGQIDKVMSLFADDGGRIWIGTGHDGAYVIDGTSPTPRPVKQTATGAMPLTDEIYAIGAGPSGDIWLGAAGTGIVAVDPKTFKTRTIAHDATLRSSLGNNNVWTILRDRAGSVWVGGAGGLDRATANQGGATTLFGGSHRADTLSAADVSAVLPMANGTSWLGFLSGGIDIADPATGVLTHLTPDPARPDTALPTGTVDQMIAPGDGAVYVATHLGIYRVSSANRDVSHLTVPLRDPNQASSAILFDDGVLWFGGWVDGVWSLPLRAGTHPVVGHLDGQQLTDQRVTVLARGKSADLWIGTLNGLNRLDLGSGTVEPIPSDPANPAALATGLISSLLVDRSGRLWVGTLEGLHVMVGRDGAGQPQFRRLATTEGLPNANVAGLTQDMTGKIWASTAGGLAQIDPDTFAVRAFRRGEGVAIASYWAKSAATAGDGALLFGGQGGLTVIRPDRMGDWNYRPSVVVTEARIGGKLVSASRFNIAGPAEPLVVPADANSLSVEFSALDFTAPERNRYAYRLDGFDADWVDSDSGRRLAAYTNLPPGDHMLRLRGSNRDGVWTETALSLPVTVLPAWYQTLWFRIALALVGAGLVIALIQGRTAYLRRRQKELERQIAERTAEVVRQKQDIEQAYARLDGTLRELRDTQGRLVQQEKLASLGQLVAGVAHEVNTPIGIALAASSQVADEVGRFDTIVASGKLKRTDLTDFMATLRDLSSLLVRSSTRAGKLIQSFKAVAADRSSDERRRFELRGYVEDVVDSMRPLLAKSPVAVTVKGDDPAMDSYPGALSQVVINLISNALAHAFDPDRQGAIAIRVAMRDAAHAEVIVRDDGRGIPPDVLPHIFDPFFTTRRGSGGTGLGLHIAHNLTTGTLGGTLEVATAIGRGTTFTLVLPVSAPSPA